MFETNAEVERQAELLEGLRQRRILAMIKVRQRECAQSMALGDELPDDIFDDVLDEPDMFIESLSAPVAAYDNFMIGDDFNDGHEAGGSYRGHEARARAGRDRSSAAYSTSSKQSRGCCG